MISLTQVEIEAVRFLDSSIFEELFHAASSLVGEGVPSPRRLINTFADEIDRQFPYLFQPGEVMCKFAWGWAQNGDSNAKTDIMRGLNGSRRYLIDEDRMLVPAKPWSLGGDGK